MTLEQLEALYRSLARDKVAPYLADAEAVTAFLNEAVEQAAIRARLIHDDSTAEVCEIDIALVSSAYPTTYTLHASLYEITSARLFTPADTTEPVDLKLVSREWLNREVPDWRESTEDPIYAVQHDKTLRIVPGPNADGLLKLEGYRTPITQMLDAADEPEINGAHHRHLVQWVLHRVFGTPDSEIYDPTRGDRALAEFERHFGPPVDSDLRRSTRIDAEHHNQAILP